LEDLVATLGVLVALACIGMAHWSGDARWDGVGSIIIGLMMGAIAVKLGLMNRRLLLGHAMNPEREAEVRAFLEAQPSIEAVHLLRTRVIATGQFKLQADLDFDGTVIGRAMSGWVRERLPTADSEIEAFSAAVGEEATRRIALEVDRLERELRIRFPELKFMDLEAD
jgi:Co/Zn/Cd efflux system component